MEQPIRLFPRDNPEAVQISDDIFSWSESSLPLTSGCGDISSRGGTIAKFSTHVNDFYKVLFCLSFLPAIVMLVWFIRRYVATVRTRPNIAKEDIVYQEWFASGVSQKNILTKIGGARNCLRLVVTPDLLWVTSWFPFTVFAAAYDLVHVIPLRSILPVQRARFLGCDTLLLSYTDDSGINHTLRLMPKKQEQFLAAIQTRP
jgi:hypothetical protein